MLSKAFRPNKTLLSLAQVSSLYAKHKLPFQPNA